MKKNLISCSINENNFVVATFLDLIHKKKHLCMRCCNHENLVFVCRPKQSCPECRMSDRFSDVRHCEFESTVTGEGEGQNTAVEQEEGGARSTESFTRKNYFLPDKDHDHHNLKQAIKVVMNIDV